MKYRKKPVVIEALCLIPENKKAILAWSSKRRPIVIVSNDGGIKYAEITTLEGVHKASPGDWIIRGVKGECYPCKPDIFEMTYEPVV